MPLNLLYRWVGSLKNELNEEECWSLVQLISKYLPHFYYCPYCRMLHPWKPRQPLKRRTTRNTPTQLSPPLKFRPHNLPEYIIQGARDRYVRNIKNRNLPLNRSLLRNTYLYGPKKQHWNQELSPRSNFHLLHYS